MAKQQRKSELPDQRPTETPLDDIYEPWFTDDVAAARVVAYTRQGRWQIARMLARNIRDAKRRQSATAWIDERAASPDAPIAFAMGPLPVAAARAMAVNPKEAISRYEDPWVKEGDFDITEYRPEEQRRGETPTAVHAGSALEDDGLGAFFDALDRAAA